MVILMYLFMNDKQVIKRQIYNVLKFNFFMVSIKYLPCGNLCDAETYEGKKLGLCLGCVESNGSPRGCIKSEHPKEYQDIEVCPIWECSM